jgi:excisionase family DNA binding protein
MRIVEMLEMRRQALRVSEVASLFCVTPQHIYKMTAMGALPSLRIAGAIRFDPQELVNWLKAKNGETLRPKTTSRRQSTAA